MTPETVAAVLTAVSGALALWGLNQHLGRRVERHARIAVAFLAGWVAACLTVAASVLWLTNAGAGRRLHHKTTDPPRSIP